MGAETEAPASERENIGAANATDLEWGARPAFMPHQVAARCQGGLLWTTRPRSPVLKAAGGWVDRLKAPSFNPFYADLEADAQARVAALRAARPAFNLRTALRGSADRHSARPTGEALGPHGQASDFALESKSIGAAGFQSNSSDRIRAAWPRGLVSSGSRRQQQAGVVGSGEDQVAVHDRSAKR